MKKSSLHDQRLFDQPTPEIVAARIRHLRKSRNLSLAQVEILSHGSIKAVVLGSYERCNRSLSIKRAIQLANFFGVPIAYLFSEPTSSSSPSRTAHPVIDLRAASKGAFVQDEKSKIFSLYFAWIAAQRQDWNGEVMSLRSTDVATLGLMAFSRESEVLEYLNSFGLLIAAPTHP
jgi:transcriptional regulator with XRE-family HTH domain